MRTCTDYCPDMHPRSVECGTVGQRCLGSLELHRSATARESREALLLEPLQVTNTSLSGPEHYSEKRGSERNGTPKRMTSAWKMAHTIADDKILKRKE
jgi:hypothetical protein